VRNAPPLLTKGNKPCFLVVVYFNVVCSIKHIITALDAWQEYETSNSRPQVFTSTSNDPDRLKSERQFQTQTSSSDSYQMANLRLRLSPLVATENQLADILSGGITVTGSGKGNVYARSGWQFRGLGSSVRSKRSRTTSSNASEKGSEDPFFEDIANMLGACQEDIQALWKHPSVTGSIANRRLRLEAWET
jgi:guanine nucleotide-binding protein alpha-1 subunit